MDIFESRKFELQDFIFKSFSNVNILVSSIFVRLCLAGIVQLV